MPVTPPYYEVDIAQPTTFELGSNPCPPTSGSIPLDNCIPITSKLIPRVNNPNIPQSDLNTLGIPGSNFIGSDHASAVWYQGEDVIYDAFLYLDGKPIDLTKYTLNVIVKASQYLITYTWAGILNNGIYTDSKDCNHYVIFIPNSVTGTLLEGTYELDVWAVGLVNQAISIKPRTSILGKSYFNIEYAAFSPNPDSIETGAANKRSNVPNSYPRPFNTVQGNNGQDNCAYGGYNGY
jgi:hypothetical protein